jgi:hypothetical protein
MARVPSLVAFDLDDTLWSPEMWLCSGPPWKTQAGRVYDRSGTEIELIGASQRVLHELATQVCATRRSQRQTTQATAFVPSSALLCVCRAVPPAPRCSGGSIQLGCRVVKRESPLQLGRSRLVKHHRRRLFCQPLRLSATNF